MADHPDSWPGEGQPKRLHLFGVVRFLIPFLGTLFHQFFYIIVHCCFLFYLSDTSLLLQGTKLP